MNKEERTSESAISTNRSTYDSSHTNSSYTLNDSLDDYFNFSNADETSQPQFQEILFESIQRINNMPVNINDNPVDIDYLDYIQKKVCILDSNKLCRHGRIEDNLESFNLQAFDENWENRYQGKSEEDNLESFNLQAIDENWENRYQGKSEEDHQDEVPDQNKGEEEKLNEMQLNIFYRHCKSSEESDIRYSVFKNVYNWSIDLLILKEKPPFIQNMIEKESKKLDFRELKKKRTRKRKNDGVNGKKK
jgi:hypothetical protein